MKILHTSDWHIGKRVGRYDRAEDHRAAVEEVAAVADREAADLVVISGDLFDRPLPPIEALELAVDALRRLGRSRPVVAIAGNHDSPELFDVLAPLLRPSDVHLVGGLRRPDEGGIVRVDTPSGPAAVACFPFLREGRVVDFMEDAGKWYGAYGERVKELCHAYNASLAREPGCVTVLTAHFCVTGVQIGGNGQPRGERELHMGQAYTADAQAIPAGPQYVAMGHIHAPQRVPGAPVPAEYAGSLLELDFGEAGEQKRVVLVDVEPGSLAEVRSVPLTAGRRLMRAKGRWADVLERPELRDAYLDLTVETDGPDAGLAARARDEFPYLVKVRAEYEQAERERAARGNRSWDELYADYHAERYGSPPEPELAAAFADVERVVLEGEGDAAA